MSFIENELPKWLQPHNGHLTLPVLADGRWYGWIEGVMIDITDEYLEWSKRLRNEFIRKSC